MKINKIRNLLSRKPPFTMEAGQFCLTKLWKSIIQRTQVTGCQLPQLYTNVTYNVINMLDKGI